MVPGDLPYIPWILGLMLLLEIQGRSKGLVETNLSGKFGQKLHEKPDKKLKIISKKLDCKKYIGIAKCALEMIERRLSDALLTFEAGCVVVNLAIHRRDSREGKKVSTKIAKVRGERLLCLQAVADRLGG